MQALNQTPWDVVISGTGIAQSLLALALSRSGKKVLHVDRNDYYGGAEAAFSLQEVDAWVESINSASEPSPFKHAAFIQKPEAGSETGLGFSRAYSISLSPQLIYTRSNLLPALISSKVYRQLEFLAVGSWWTYDCGGCDGGDQDDATGSTPAASSGKLQKVPGGREDVFGDTNINLRSTRALMKFLKLAADVNAHAAILEEWGQKPFPEFLTAYVKVPSTLQSPLLALTLSPDPPAQTTTSYALPRISRHLTSIGLLGPGFSSLVPRWGGLAEVAQVACRALAVGGGIYVLKQGVKSVKSSPRQSPSESPSDSDGPIPPLKIRLEGGEEIHSYWVIGNSYDLPQEHRLSAGQSCTQISHSISIVSSPLTSLFPIPSEGSPPPAGVLIVFPTGSLGSEEQSPVYLIVHTSDTGECPTGQCVIYASINLNSSSEASQILTTAVERFLAAVPEEPETKVLWSVFYMQDHTPFDSPNHRTPSASDSTAENALHSRILQLPDLQPGLALEDDLLRGVRNIWEEVAGGGGEGFLQFSEREGMGDEGDEEDSYH